MAIISIFVYTAMNHANKVRSKYISAWLLAVMFLILTVQSRERPAYLNSFHNLLTLQADTPNLKKNKIPSAEINLLKKQDSVLSIEDTIPPKNKRINNIDTTILEATQDTIDLKISQDSLDAPISYDAEDSMILDVPSKKITLYGKETKTHYKDNDLTAPVIELDQQTGNLTASIRRDSTGKVISMPTFKQGDFTSQSDSLKFNLKSGKGITKSTYTQQGEIYVYGQTIKKFDNNVFFVKRARFTTCNLDTPHFAFVSNRIKFINQKIAITGPVHPEFEGVPIPIYLPFGIFPLSQGRHSGFLLPTFTSNEQFGLGLERLGYYKVLSDYWDVILTGNVYSYGGWTANINPRYKKLYRYQGNISFDIQSFKYNFKGDPDYAKNRSYHLNWSHTSDTRSRPGTNFSASVNAGSSSFNSFIPNDPYRNFSNQLQSSIVYSKTWNGKRNLTLSANHNQNTLQKLININLPDVAYNVNTLYPFRKKEFVGTPKWFENIGVAYNGNAKSLFSFYDTTKNIFKHILDTFQWGAHHSIPISLSLPQIGAFQIGPSISYDETWYQRKFVRSWDTVNKKLDTTITKGFYTAREMSFGLGISTRIFGLIAAKNKNAKIQAIRHEIRPTIGISYKPDFNKKYYYKTLVDSINKIPQEFSVFSGNVFSPYGQGEFGGISFGLDNNIQMKVRNKKDTGENALKKVTLIDGLSLNTSYNFLRDSFQLNNFNISLRTNLFEKLNITGSANLDPYDVNFSTGQRLKSLLWQRKPFSLGRLLSGSISASSQFQGGNKTAKDKKSDLATNDYREGAYPDDEYGSDLAYIRNNPNDFADFNIPWSVNFSYALRFDKVFQPILKSFTTEFNQDINGGGTLNLTKKWQIALNGSYNISQNQVGYVSVSLSREMHCWQMVINLAPVGRYRFFSINISPKSGLLRDLKINRTRYTYDAL